MGSSGVKILEAHRMRWPGPRRGWQIGMSWGEPFWGGARWSVTVEFIVWRFTLGIGHGP